VRLIFDVKAEKLIDARRAWFDRGQSIRVITASLFLGSRLSKQLSEDLKMRDTPCDPPLGECLRYPDIPHI
jgi:hypothetical protein